MTTYAINRKRSDASLPAAKDILRAVFNKRGDVINVTIADVSNDTKKNTDIFVNMKMNQVAGAISCGNVYKIRIAHRLRTKASAGNSHKRHFTIRAVSKHGRMTERNKIIDKGYGDYLLYMFETDIVSEYDWVLIDLKRLREYIAFCEWAPNNITYNRDGTGFIEYGIVDCLEFDNCMIVDTNIELVHDTMRRFKQNIDVPG